MTRLAKARPALYLLGSITMMAVLDTVVPAVTVVGWPWNLVGLLPLAAGAALIAASMIVLARARTPAEPFQVPAALVTAGPFRFSRNPMYLGAALILLGIAFFFGSGTPFLVIPLYMAAMRLRVIAAEEQAMASRFGDAYAAYQAAVRRWL